MHVHVLSFLSNREHPQSIRCISRVKLERLFN